MRLFATLLATMFSLLLSADAFAADETHTAVFRPQASKDDTYATSTESVYLQSIAYWPYRNADRISCVRFACEIPRGAEIISATLAVHTDGRSGDTSPSTLRLEVLDFDDAPALNAPNPFSHPVKSEYVDWVLPADWRADTWYSSPDLSAPVQAFVDSPAYQLGAHIGFKATWRSGSYKIVHQWDEGDHSHAPTLTVEYRGGEALVDLLMAEPEVRIAQKIYCRTTNVNTDDTLQASLDGRVIFSKPGDEIGDEEMFVADYSSLTAGSHTLAVQVIAPDLTVRGEKVRTWTTLHDGVPHVGLNVDNAICIDGEPFLPVTPWILRSDRIALMPDAINTLLGVGWYATNDLNAWQDYLGQGQANDMYVVGPASFPGVVSNHLSDSDFNVVANYVNTTKTHPSLFAWFWFDEPDLYADNAPGIRMLHDVTRLNDTDHPTWTNLVGYRLTHNDDGWYNDRVQEYCYMHNASIFGERTMVADIIGMDYYPHEYSTYYDFCNLSDYLLALDRLQDWNYNLAPTATFIQPCDEASPDNPRLSGRDWSPPPTPAMVKNLIWLSLIHEAKAVSYFTYFEWFTDRPALSVMNESLVWIEDLTQPILSSPENVTETVAVTPASGYRVDILPRRYDGALYIFSGEVRDWGDPVYIQPDPADITTAYFNIPQESFTARIDVSDLPAGATVTVYGEGRTLTSQAGYFEDTFDVHDVHIYIIADAASAAPGDADGDGDVDIDDFVILKCNFGTRSGATRSQGDFDADGDVDIDDFIILKCNFGRVQN